VGREFNAGRVVALLLVLAWMPLLLGPGAAQAEIKRDRADVPGPLDLVQVKFGQHVRHVVVRVRTQGHLPHLRRLDRHPARSGKHPGRYLCFRFKSHSTGRRLLCPAGRMRHGRIGVGVSGVTKKGRTVPHGAIVARAHLGRRTLSFKLGLRRLGLRPGRISFGADSAWPGCRHHPKRGGTRDGKCTDHAPDHHSGKERIYPLERSGCGGISGSKFFHGSREHKDVALTFDDGPSEYTDNVLRILADHHVHGTFFEIGEQVPSYPSLVDRIVPAGNELGNHSLHHEDGPGYSSIKRTQELIEDASGFEPCAFRPPGGYEPSSTYEAAQALDLVSVIWDVDPRDWDRPGEEAIYQRATSVQPGSIVLLHDGGGDRSQTVAALPRIIENLKSRGYHLVTITHMLGGHYHYAEVHHHHERSLPAPRRYPLHREGP
jgi:peptidoglycan/xylan/chitin deacetylase (PgdA/CDA1 family)